MRHVVNDQDDDQDEVSIMNGIYTAGIQFNENELDAVLMDMSIETKLTLEQQRAVVVVLLTAFSLATALTDEKVFKQSISELNDSISKDDQIIEFLFDFGSALAQELYEDLELLSSRAAIFKRRAFDFLRLVSQTERGCISQ